MKKYNLFFYGLAIVFAVACVVVSCGKDNESDNSIHVTSISLIDNDGSLELAVIGQTKTLTASVQPPNATNKTIVWTSSNMSIVTVDQTGGLKAEGVGSAVVKALSDDGGFEAACNVTVTGKGIRIESITITPATASITVDGERQLSVTIEPPDATVQEMIWTTDSAYIATVDENGLVKAGRMSLGTTKIWATATDGTNTKASIDVEVYMDEPDIEMVSIESAGKSFPMGWYWHPTGGSHISEMPVHTVSFTYDYKIGKHNITRKQWLWVMRTVPGGSNGTWSSLTTKGRAGDLPELDLPASGISWDAADDFVKKLSEKTGRKFRLPTEAEWEFAAVGRDATGKPLSWYGGKAPEPEWGWNGGVDPPNKPTEFDLWDTDSEDNYPYQPWYVGWGSWNSVWGKGQSPYSDNIQPIGTKHPNERGIYDMLGNVCEWCSDYFSFSYYGKRASGDDPAEPNNVTDPKGPAAECKECQDAAGMETSAEGTENCGRAIRGGNQNNQGALKVMYRTYYPQSTAGGSQGLRVVEGELPD